MNQCFKKQDSVVIVVVYVVNIPKKEYYKTRKDI